MVIKRVPLPPPTISNPRILRNNSSKLHTISIVLISLKIQRDQKIRSIVIKDQERRSRKKYKSGENKKRERTKRKKKGLGEGEREKEGERKKK